MYPYYRLEYFRLSDIRDEMHKYREVSKDEMIKGNQEEGKEWKWVYVVKEHRPKIYSRFWRPQKIDEKDGNQKS